MKELIHMMRKKWSRIRAMIVGKKKLFNNGDHECISMEEKECTDQRKQWPHHVFKVSLTLPATAASLVRVPSRGLKAGLRKLGRVQVSMPHDQEEELEEEEEMVELCKKRIIMGKKCRPLNVSGVLHYDNHGVLVPEHILSPSPSTS